jgi:hypothetical protein
MQRTSQLDVEMDPVKDEVNSVLPDVDWERGDAVEGAAEGLEAHVRDAAMKAQKYSQVVAVIKLQMKKSTKKDQCTLCK